MLVGLHAGREVIHIRLEWRLERLVPIHQIRQDRQRIRVERVKPRPEHVGHSALVHEDRHLRVAHRQLAAVLDFAILHRKAVGQDAIRGLDPIDDIDELFGQKITQAHEGFSLPDFDDAVAPAECTRLIRDATVPIRPCQWRVFRDYCKL